jgi:hypothetical protein
MTLMIALVSLMGLIGGVVSANEAAHKPAIVLNDGDTVVCGGVRLWRCQTQPSFEMVEHHWGAPNRKKADPTSEEKSGPCCALPKDYIEAKGAIDVRARDPRKLHRDFYLFVMRFLDNNENETMRQGGLVDIGCEDGTLLIELLGHHRTLGIDVPFFIDSTRALRPDREWSTMDAVTKDLTGAIGGRVLLPEVAAGIAISARFLERAPNADEALAEMVNGTLLASVDYFILGFHARDPEFTRGPPAPSSGIFRQWSEREFVAYLKSRGLVVIDGEKVHSSSPKDATKHRWVVARRASWSPPPYYMLGKRMQELKE